MSETARGTPWRLGVTCDSPGCGAHFEGDFIVAEDSTRGERLRVVLNYAEKHGWRVTRRRPIGDSLTYCPPCRELTGKEESDGRPQEPEHRPVQGTPGP